MLSLLNIITQSVVLLNVDLLNIVVLNFVMLSVDILSVLTPNTKFLFFWHRECLIAECCSTE